jgi:hypothetical protein
MIVVDCSTIGPPNTMCRLLLFRYTYCIICLLVIRMETYIKENSKKKNHRKKTWGPNQKMKKEKIDRHKKTTQRNLNLTRKHCRNTDTDGKKQTGTKK